MHHDTEQRVERTDKTLKGYKKNSCIEHVTEQQMETAGDRTGTNTTKDVKTLTEATIDS